MSRPGSLSAASLSTEPKSILSEKRKRMMPPDELQGQQMDAHGVEDDLADDDGADEDDRGIDRGAARDAVALGAGQRRGQAREEREIADRIDGRPDQHEVAEQFGEHGALGETLHRRPPETRSQSYTPSANHASAFAVAVDAVEAAVGELDVPVVAVGGRVAPPSVFERPGSGGDADGAGDRGRGVGGEGLEGRAGRDPSPLLPLPAGEGSPRSCLSRQSPPARPAGAGRARRGGRVRRAGTGARSGAAAGSSPRS